MPIVLLIGAVLGWFARVSYETQMGVTRKDVFGLQKKELEAEIKRLRTQVAEIIGK